MCTFFACNKFYFALCIRPFWDKHIIQIMEKIMKKLHLIRGYCLVVAILLMPVTGMAIKSQVSFNGNIFYSDFQFQNPSFIAAGDFYEATVTFDTDNRIDWDDVSYEMFSINTIELNIWEENLGTRYDKYSGLYTTDQNEVDFIAFFNSEDPEGNAYDSIWLDHWSILSGNEFDTEIYSETIQQLTIWADLPDVFSYGNYSSFEGSEVLFDSILNSFILEAESSVTFGDVEYVTGAPVPEPTTMLLLGSGLIGLAGFRRKKFK